MMKTLFYLCYEIKHLTLRFRQTGLVILLSSVVSFSFAQSTINGTVSGDGEVLTGATVLVKGTTIGTVTDLEGNYSLPVPTDATILVYSFVGYESQEITINGRSQIDIILSAGQELSEVVVVGYGVQKKSDLTGAISSVKGKDLVSFAAGNPTATLQGKLSGVQVETFGGQPGGDVNIFVRGIASLTNANPLYVIDGTFADNMNFINPNDIESIEVLKDASTAAIYGSRAANGVVLISTKRGDDSGGLKVDLNIRTGFEFASNRLDFLNSEQFLDYRDDIVANDGGSPINRADFTENGQLIFTDWQDESLSTGLIQDYGVSIYGGNEDAQYYVSSNYFQQDGILIGSGYDRINLRANTKFKFRKFTINQSLGLSRTNREENEWFGFEGATAPILRRNNPNNEGGFESPDDDTAGFGGINKFALASLEDNNDRRNNILGNINIGYEIVEGLSFKINLGAEYTSRLRTTFRPTYFLSDTDPRFNVNDENDLTNWRQEILVTQVEPTLSYSKNFNAHQIDAVIGYGIIEQQLDQVAVYVSGLPSNGIRGFGNTGTENVQGIGGDKVSSALISGFGRVNYNFDSKYYLTGTVRYDASSRFSENNRSGVFPSFSAGWRITDESFFPQNNVVTDIKLRGGYGQIGSQNLGDYLYQSVINTSSGVSFGNQALPGFAQTNFANENLTWETTTTTNIGADVSLLNGQITLSGEYYRKNVEDVLALVPIPSSNGTSVPITQNAGEFENSGIDLELVYRKNQGDFKFDIGVNLATQNSKITRLPSPFLGPSVNEALQRVNRSIEGAEPGSFYGFIVDGVYNNQAEIDNDPNRAADDISSLSPGDFIKRDLDGNGIVDNDDLTVLGSAVPDFTYGINFSGTYKNWDFGVNFTGVQGNEIYNQARAFNTLFADDNKLTDVLDRWTPENPNGSLPRATETDLAGNSLPSSFFVEDGSYLRLRTLSVGYNFRDIVKTDYISNLRLYVTAQNLFVLTGYSGYDPDVSSTNGARSNENDGFFGFRPSVNNISGRGIDIRAYPNATSIIFGVNVTF